VEEGRNNYRNSCKAFFTQLKAWKIMESKLHNTNVTKKLSPHTKYFPKPFCKTIVGAIYEKTLETFQSSPSLLSVNLFFDQGGPNE
jgi:hypothetical protein